MTLPASGYLLLGADGGASGRSVNSEFGYGNDMASYQGVYYGKGALSFQFPTVGNTFAMDLFYSTFKISGGSQSFTSSNPSYTIPVYNTMTITVTGGGGGSTGQPGVIQSPCAGAGSITPPNAGSPGGTSSFGGYVSGAGGGSDTGGVVNSQTFTNPVQGGSGPPSGTNVAVTIGTGGAGGIGGCYIYQFVVGATDFGCSCWSRFATGATGANGSVQISWS